MTTRREILSLGLSALTVPYIGRCEPIKSMLGANDIASEDTLKNPYSPDGLIAMFDGEWNVGLGIHDEESPIWKDLIGDTYLSIVTGRGEFQSNGLCLYGGGYAATGLFPYSSAIRTIEICYSDIESEGRWIEVNSPNLGFYSQFNKSVMYVSATTQPKCATIKNLLGSTISVVYKDDYSAEVFSDGEYATASNGSTSSVASASNRITIGGRYGSNSAGVALKGIFHCIRLYSRQLNQEEVHTNYIIDQERFNLP